jgi:hypothetical protein
MKVESALIIEQQIPIGGNATRRRMPSQHLLRETGMGCKGSWVVERLLIFRTDLTMKIRARVAQFIVVKVG